MNPPRGVDSHDVSLNDCSGYMSFSMAMKLRLGLWALQHRRGPGVGADLHVPRFEHLGQPLPGRHQADAALREAKESGKNSIRIVGGNGGGS